MTRKNSKILKNMMKLLPNKTDIQNTSTDFRFCIRYIKYKVRLRTPTLNSNELTDFLKNLFFYPKTLLNCPAVFQLRSLGGVLLDRVNPLLCKLYVRGRGKPSTWLPRQKLAESRRNKIKKNENIFS